MVQDHLNKPVDVKINMNTHHYDSDHKHNWFLEYENISESDVNRSDD